VATFAFCLLIVGSNIPTPLFPTYRHTLELSTFTVTVIFAVYLLALVVTFTVAASTPLSRHSIRALPAAVAVCIAADAALIAGGRHLPLLLTGRVLTGIAVGIGTGAAAALVLATRGERGRAIAATGTLAGSFLGLTGSALIGEYLPLPTVTVYLVHLVLLAGALGVLLVMTRRMRTALTHALHAPALREVAPPATDADLAAAPITPAPITPGLDTSGHGATRPSRRLTLAGDGLGAGGWAIGGVVVGLLPTVVAEEWGSTSIIVPSLAPAILIGTACISPRIFRSLRPMPVLLLIAAGSVIYLGGVWAGSLPAILACCAVWGIGQGFAYADGLRIVTAGLMPIAQGRAASRYASVCYGFSGVLAVSTGFAATGAGTLAAMVVMTAVFVALCAATVALGHRQWRA